MILCGICVPHSQPSIADNHCHNPRVALAELCKFLSLQKYEFSELSTCLQLKSCTLHYCSKKIQFCTNCRALQNQQKLLHKLQQQNKLCIDTTVLSLQQEISAATKEQSGGFVDIVGHFAASICGKH